MVGTENNDGQDFARDANSLETEDHTAIQHAISQAQGRERAITRTHNSRASRRYAIGWSIVILACGVFLVLAGIGWRISQDVDDISSVTFGDVARAVQLKSHVESQTGGLVEKFVLFVTSPSGLNIAPTLETGIEYADNLSLKPTSQWCYLRKPNEDGTFASLYIRNWNGNSGNTFPAISAAHAEIFGTTADKLETLMEKCGFVGEAVMSSTAIRNAIARSRQRRKGNVQSTEAMSITGSGFAVSHEGYVVTNSHVIDNCRNLSTRMDGVQADMTVVTNDRQNDLAVLKAAIQPRAIAVFRGGRSIRQGDTIIAVGFPLQGLLSDDLKVTDGLVNSLAGLGGDFRMIQFSAEVQPGSSGGPLLDTAGNVVGVVTAKINALKLSKYTGGDIAQNINFAMKASMVRDMLEAKHIDYETASNTDDLDTADIVERAKNFTILINCLN